MDRIRMSAARDGVDDKRVRSSGSMLRWTAGTVLIVGLLGYLLALVFGRLPQNQRLGAGDAVVIMVIALIAAALLWPRLISQVEELSVFNVRLKVRQIETSLEEQQLHIDQQQQVLKDIELLIGSLLTHEERLFLRELSQDSSNSHHGGEELSRKLYRLRGLGMVDQRAGTHISAVKDLPRVVLKDYLHLTPTAEVYLRRARDIIEPERY